MTSQEMKKLIKLAKPVTFKNTVFQEVFTGTPIFQKGASVRIKLEDGNTWLFHTNELVITATGE